MRAMRWMVWCAGSVAALATGACADQRVVLGRGAQALAYDCGDLRPQAKGDAGRGLIHGYAVNVVRDARNHGRLHAVDSLTQAFAQGDEPRVERHVVRYVCAFGDPSAAVRRVYPESGSTAPEIVLARYAGPKDTAPPFRLSQHRGRIVVLAFWGTYCKPCLRELPVLAKLAAQVNDPRLAVYTVLYHDRPQPAAEWLATHHVDLPLLVDEGGTVKDATGTIGVPMTLVVAPDGKVAFTNGYPNGELEAYIHGKLAELPPVTARGGE